MEIARELTNSNEIATQCTAYAPAPEFADLLPGEDKAHIDDLLAGFSNMLGDKFTFDNLELYGTALYCLRALQENEMSWDREALVQEFRAWKGSKYPEDQISAAYALLVEEFNCNQAEAVQ